nr:hypothetical protein [Nanoarchaeota archaeon]
MEEGIINESEFLRHHEKQVERKSQKDVFFIWMLIIFISVIAAHFILNFTGSSPTGFVTATQSTTTNATLLIRALFIGFVIIMITALIYIGITRKDR